jgi:hypothetical protein
MGLSRANLPDDEEALIAARIAFSGEIASQEMGVSKRRVGAGKISVVVCEFAMLVSARNARCRKEGMSARPELAVATGYAAVVDAGGTITVRGDGLPACTFAQWANIYLGLNHLGTSSSKILFRLCTLGVVHASNKRWSAVYIL